MSIFEPESKEQRLIRRINKFRREREHIDYLLKKGYHPIKIADQLTHNMFVSMRIGLEQRFPDASAEEIDKKMRELVVMQSKLKKKGCKIKY